MANTRIKDISTAATTLNSDDFIAVDGSTAGTRKMAKADLITEVSTGVSGTYLEESNNLSDVASKDTSKLNLEVPDVGTAPNEVPLNSMLSGMAYMSPDSVAMGTVEITDKIDLSGAPTQQLEISGDAPTVRVTDTSVSVANGESIGKLEFYGNDGSSGGPNVRASIDTVAEAAAGNYYGLAISTSASNASPVEHIRVASNGNTGIGTASPDVTLDCSGSTDNSEYAHFSNSNQRHLKLSSYDVGGNTNAGHDINASSSVGALSLSTGGTQRVRIDSTGRVGIGTTSPGSYYSESNDLVIGDVSGDRGITVVSGTAGTGSLFFADGTSGEDAYRGQIRYLHNANQLMFAVNANEAFRIGSGGDIVMASGNGIDYGSGASTTLDNYEIGGYNATLTPFTSGTITVDSTSDRVQYTRVGDLVSITGKLAVSAVSSPVGNYVKLSLPFTIADPTEAAGHFAGSCLIFNAAGNLGDYSIIGIDGESFVRIYKTTSSGSVATAQDFSGNEIVYFGFSYHTS